MFEILKQSCSVHTAVSLIWPVYLAVNIINFTFASHLSSPLFIDDPEHNFHHMAVHMHQAGML
jgi:hypothetical protein